MLAKHGKEAALDDLVAEVSAKGPVERLGAEETCARHPLLR
ncbi:hypothetical protein [uncultured Shimia sp.]|nr:hypothetical protein [uncultured Shimia sp.]